MTRTKRKIIKFSNYSFCITLPKKAINELGWEKGQEVSVNFDNKSKKISIFQSRSSHKKSVQRPNTKGRQKTTRQRSGKAKVKPIPRLRW